MGFYRTTSVIGKQDSHFVWSGSAASDLGGYQCEITIDFQRAHPALQPVGVSGGCHAGRLDGIRYQGFGDRGYHG